MLKALWRAFVDSLIDNDEKVASSKKHIRFKTRVQKPYPIYDKNNGQIDALFLTKTAKKPYNLGLQLPP